MLSSPNSTARRTTGPRDARYQIVSGGDAQAVAAIEAFGDTILRRGRGADAILDAAEIHTQCPMVQACAAALHLLADTRAGIDQAKARLAPLGRASVSRREALFIAALNAIAWDDIRRADSLFLALAAEAPEDLLAGYLGHLHFLNHGQSEAMLAQARLLSDAAPGNPFALGMLAFAQHENGAIDAAADSAGLADAADPSLAWGHHAAAHVYLSRGQYQAGLVWLESRARCWQDCGSSMLTHNWWHMQLLLLRNNDMAAALGIYDRLIADEAAQSVSSFVNAAALLARIAVRGGDVGARWTPLAAIARAQSGQHVLPFIDLHYALALAGSGDVAGCAALMRSAWQHAALSSGAMRDAWTLAGLPLLDAITATAAGDAPRAAQSFARGLPHLARIGGSHQQRSLFQELAADQPSLRRVAFGTSI